MPLEAPIKARAKREDGTGLTEGKEDKESGALNGERGMIASLGSASLAIRLLFSARAFARAFPN